MLPEFIDNLHSLGLASIASTQFPGATHRRELVLDAPKLLGKLSTRASETDHEKQ